MNKPNTTDWRINAWWRNGDNPTACGITYDFSREKYLVSDFTGRTFGNIDLIDFMTKHLGIGFRKAIDTLVFSCGKEDGFGNVEQLEASGYQQKTKLEKPVPIDPNVLQTFDSGILHQFWHNRGYTHQVAQHFQLGYCNYGFLKGRLTIPIYDETNRLVAIQGRASNDDIEPKYLFGSSEQGESAKLTFYNIRPAWEAAQKRGWIGVVESANSVWRAKQYGYDNFLASLNASLTPRQVKLLRLMRVNVVIMYDFDASETMAGQIGAIKAANLLKAEGINCWCVNIGFDADPADLSIEQFHMSLKNAREFQS